MVGCIAVEEEDGWVRGSLVVGFGGGGEEGVGDFGMHCFGIGFFGGHDFCSREMRLGRRMAWTGTS